MEDAKRNKQGIASELSGMVRRNVRAYAMYVALILIILYFYFQTGGAFLRSANIVNLVNQAGYVAVLAIGMTLVIIIRHIDLSVGYAAGFAGAIIAIMISHMEMNTWLSIFLVLILGLVIGLYQGSMVVFLSVPAFVVTLAGQFIFRGILMEVLSGGTILITKSDFTALGSKYLTDYIGGSPLVVTLVIGIASITAVIYSQIKNRMQKQKYNFEVLSMPIFVVLLITTALALGVFTWVLAGHQGIPMSLCIVLVIMLIYNFMLNKTKLGRYIYAVGGNPEAALLSGINVKKVTMFCFCSMGVLAALSGILYTARLKSAAPGTGLGFELDAIASSYIGGAAVGGGVGKVTNTLIGVFIIISLTNGLNLMNVGSSWQYVVKGIIFVVAVAFDIISQKRAG